MHRRTRSPGRVAAVRDAQLQELGPYLLESGPRLGVNRVLSHQEDDRHVGVDQGQRSVLQLAGEDAFCHEVRELLDLEGGLEAGSVLVTTAHDCRCIFGQLELPDREETTPTD